MKEKLCKFTEEEWAVLEQIRSKNNLSSDAAALRYVILDYQVIKSEINCYENIADLVSEKIIAHYKKEIIGMLHTSRAAEKNTTILLDIMNTLLFKEDVTQAIITDKIKAPVIKEAEENYKKKIESKKQKKDFASIREGER